MNSIPAESFLASLATTSHKRRVPEGVTFELTYGCNLRCVHCYNPTHRALPNELSTQEIFSILDQIADLGVLNLFLTGGELFTRSDLFAIVEFATRRGFLLSLLTNATRITPRSIEQLSNYRIHQFALSMYGATQKTYERVTGIPGSFQQFMDGLTQLGTTNVPVVVRMPVMKENAGEVQAARSLIESYAFKFQYSVDINPKVNGDLSPLAHRLDPQEKVRLNRLMVGYAKTPLHESTCPPNLNFFSCACGYSRFAISPYGEMNLCTIFPIPKYNLRLGTVREGWEVLKRTVDEAQPNRQYDCPSCDVRPSCKQGPVDAWLETGDMSPCLPHFKEFATLEQQAQQLLDPRNPT